MKNCIFKIFLYYYKIEKIYLISSFIMKLKKNLRKKLFLNICLCLLRLIIFLRIDDISNVYKR